MKRSWISLLLVALLFALPATAGTIAETNDEVELVIDAQEIDIDSEPVVLNKPDELFVSDLKLEETGEKLDASLSSEEPSAISVNNVKANDSDSEEFVIFDGILVQYNGPGGNVIIPDGVIGIQLASFQGCTNLETVIFPDGLVSIGERAFSLCSNLSEIVIPSTVTSIEKEAFKYCYSLQNVTVKSANIYIADDAFSSVPQSTVFHTICNTAATKWAETHMYGIDKSEHIITVLPAVEATCTEPGKNEGKYCSVCKEILVEQMAIPAMGHTPTTDLEVPPTCIRPGKTEGSHCSVCGKVFKEQKTIPALGHTEVIDKAVTPSLTQTGLTEGSHCSVCGQVLIPQEVIPKLISIKKCSITGIFDKVYAAKAFKPAPVVKYKGNTLKKGTDYTVSYKDNKNIGTATVTITGKGKYGASVNKTFKINPKPVALSSLTAGSKQLTVKWKKSKNITGYEIQYGLKSNFKSAKKVTISKASTVKTILKDLKANKTYYVRIRTYKTVKGKKYYSTWSKAKDLLNNY